MKLTSTFATFSVLMLILLTACDNIPAFVGNLFSTKEEPAKNVIVLIDCSKSIPEETAKWYQHIIANEIFTDLGKNDHLVVLPVDYGSLTSSREIYKTDFDDVELNSGQVNELRKETFEAQQFLKVKIDSFGPQLNHALQSTYESREEFGNGTDIIGALMQSEGYIKEGRKNLIVVFSDMVQETEVVNMQKDLKRDEQVSKLLQKTPKVTLANAEIIVLTGEQPKITITEFERIKTYWHSLAKRDNWNILDYNSGGQEVLRNWLKEKE